MAVPQEQLIFTEEQYLEFERNSEERHEYLDGHVYLMAGETGEHGDISSNLTITLGSQLRGKPCRVRSKDTKVRSGPQNFPQRGTKGLYSYPDIVVICGEPQYLDKYRDVITNPRVIIEVLSEKTSDFDRNEKFTRYRMWNETLTDYLLVAQLQPFVEHFERRKSGEWVYHSYQELDQKISIKSIKCELAMADIYDRLAFPAAKRKAAKKARSQRKAKKTTASR